MYIEQKQDKIYKPTSVFTRSAAEDNQVTTELQGLISEGGLTPSSSDLTQVKNAVKNLIDAATPIMTTTQLGVGKPDGTTIVADANGTLSVSTSAASANTDLSNLTATGESHFANPNLSNLTTTGKQTVASFAAPDYSAGISVTSGYVAAYDCIFVPMLSGNPAGMTIYVDNIAVGREGISGSLYVDQGHQYFVPKGSTLTFSATGSSSTYTVYPLKGAL